MPPHSSTFEALKRYSNCVQGMEHFEYRLKALEVCKGFEPLNGF